MVLPRESKENPISLPSEGVSWLQQHLIAGKIPFATHFLKNKIMNYSSYVL